MNELFGLGGPRGSGKTTAARLLGEAAGAQNHEHIEFSDSIVQVAELWIRRLAEYPESSPEEHKKWIVDILSEFVKNIQPENTIAAIPQGHLDQLYTDTHPDIRQNKEHYRTLLEWLGSSAIQLATSTVWAK